jgi:hypothetical protein
MVVCTFNPSYLGGRGRRIVVRGQLQQKYKTLPEKTKAKRAGSLDQVVEYSSNRVPPKNKTKPNKQKKKPQVPVPHTCNPSYSGSRDQEDHSSKPV